MSRRINLGPILAIAGRDLRIVRRSRAVVVPVVLVPAILLLAVPLVLMAMAGAADAVALELEPFLVRFGPEVGPLPADAGQRALVLLLVYLYAPMFLLVPIMVSSVTAADSVVGERERGTLEGLLQTPTTDLELLLGKLLAPWALSMAVTLVGAVAYGALSNVVFVANDVAARFPNPAWVVLVLWVAPAAAGIGLGLVVLISARVKTFQEASQISGIVVVPIIGLVIAQAVGVLLFDVGLLILLGGVLWLLTLLLMRFAVGRFRRERLVMGS